MKIADVMSYRQTSVDPWALAQLAARRMSESVLHALPVVDGRRVVGMVTAHDLARSVVARGLSPRSVHVREVMSWPPVTARPDESLEVGVKRMLATHIHRLIIVDAAGELLGMVEADALTLSKKTRPLGLKVIERLAAMRGQLDGVLPAEAGR